MADVAIQLLPHLIEAVHRSVRVVVVLDSGSELKGAGAKIVDVGNSGIDINVRIESGATGRHELVVVIRQRNRLNLFCDRNAWEEGSFRPPCDYGWNVGVQLLVARVDGKGNSIRCAVLCGKQVVRAGSTVGIHD